MLPRPKSYLECTVCCFFCFFLFCFGSYRLYWEFITFICYAHFIRIWIFRTSDRIEFLYLFFASKLRISHQKQLNMQILLYLFVCLLQSFNIFTVDYRKNAVSFRYNTPVSSKLYFYFNFLSFMGIFSFFLCLFTTDMEKRKSLTMANA